MQNKKTQKQPFKEYRYWHWVNVKYWFSFTLNICNISHWIAIFWISLQIKSV